MINQSIIKDDETVMMIDDRVGPHTKSTIEAIHAVARRNHIPAPPQPQTTEGVHISTFLYL